MWRIPLSDLDYGPEEQQAVLNVLQSRWLSMGPKTEEFEAGAAEYLGVKHAIAVTNCTCALELVYSRILQRRNPDATGGSGASSPKPVVVVPDITFVATANAAILSGARASFADITSLTAPYARISHVRALVEAAGDAAAAVAAVHYAGFDCEIAELRSFCNTRGIALVEDAAHAIGGRDASGRPLGTTGDASCFSFFANKNIATGEGGLVATNDDDLAASIRLMRSHGMTSLTYERHRKKSHGYDVLSPGHNYRCTEITAALAIEQLKKLDAGNERRRALYRMYAAGFSDEARLQVPFSTNDQISRGACHIFPLLCSSPRLRDAVRANLSDIGVQTSHHYPPLHSFTYFRKAGGGGVRVPEIDELGDHFPHLTNGHRSGFSFPAAVHYAAREITLPLHPNLKEVEVEEIVANILRTVAAS